MNFMSLWGAEEADEMARAAQRPIDPKVVAEHVSALSSAGDDEVKFKAALASLKADKRVVAAEFIAVAKGYAGTARKVGSKKAAEDSIEKRFVELVRFKLRNDLASGAKPW